MKPIKRSNIITFYLISVIGVFVKINHSNCKYSPIGLLKFIDVHMHDSNKSKLKCTLTHHRKIVEFQQKLPILYDQIASTINKSASLTTDEKLGIINFIKINPMLAKSSCIITACKEMVQLIDRKALIDQLIY